MIGQSLRCFFCWLYVGAFYEALVHVTRVLMNLHACMNQVCMCHIWKMEIPVIDITTTVIFACSRVPYLGMQGVL